MSQVAVSYILSRIANVADVSPSNVQTSLFSGNITVSNLTLRPATLNAILPLPIEKGEVPQLDVQIPNPSTSAPMEIQVRRAKLLLPLDLSAPPIEKSLDQVVSGISAASILGETVSPAAAQPPPENDTGHAEDAFSDFSSANSDTDEADFVSCASETELQDSETDSDGFDSSSSGDSGGGSGPSPAAGWLRYLKARATQSVEWIWQRQLCITFTDLVVVLPCDARKNINFEISVERFRVTIEPTQSHEAEQLKIVDLVIEGTTVMANAGDARSRVLAVDSLSVKITTVHATTTGRLLRKNVAVCFNGTSTIIADEASLFALLKCHITRQVMLSVPHYCRPLASLRSQPSLWPYALACVVQRRRDFHKRYNFNASHLRFYARARERYVALLNDCHHNQSVESSVQELAQCEMDVRYDDVILFLRHLVQEKYSAVPVGNSSTEVLSDDASIIHSTHFEWKVVKLALPVKNYLFLRDISLILRNQETVFCLGSMSLDSNGAVQTWTPKPSQTAKGSVDDNRYGRGGDAVNDIDSVVCVRVAEDMNTKQTKITVAELAMTGRLKQLLICMTPVADALQRIVQQERRAATQAVPPPTTRGGAVASSAITCSGTETTIVAIHKIALQVDQYELLLDRVSCTKVSTPNQPAIYGITMSNAYLRHADAYLLSPTTIRMTPQNNSITISPISIVLSNSTWAVLHRNMNDVNEFLAKVPPLAPATAAPVVGEKLVDLPFLSRFATEMAWRTLPSSQEVEMQELRLVFQPLDAHIAVQRFTLQKITEGPSRGPYGVRAQVRYFAMGCKYAKPLDFTMSLPSGFTVSLLPEERTGATLVEVPQLSCYARDLSRSADTLLLTLDSTRCVQCGPLTHIAVREATLLEAIVMAETTCLLRTDTSAILSTDRPYRASFLQLSTEVTAMRLGVLSRLPLSCISEASERVYAFLLAEIIPTASYALFFSGFSDMALQVTLDQCVISTGSPHDIYLSVSNSPGKDSHLAPFLEGFAPLLPSTATTCPIIVLNDLNLLAMKVLISSLTVRVGLAPEASPASVSVTACGALLHVPIDKPSFWSVEVQCQPLAPWRATVDSIILTVTPDEAAKRSLCQLLLKGLTFERAVTQNSAASASFAKDMPLAPSESDRGSVASSGDEEFETSVFALRRWSVEVDLAHPLDDLQKAYAMGNALLLSSARLHHCQVVKMNLSDSELYLSHCGSVFFDSPESLLLIERSHFYASTASNIRLVICTGTTVVFQDCIFHTDRAEDFIYTADRDAFYVMSRSRFEPLGANGTSFPSPVPASVESASPKTLVRRRRHQSFAVEEGVMKVYLDDAAHVTCTQRGFCYTTKHKSHRFSAKIRNNEIRVECSVAALKTAICPKLTIEGEIARHFGRNSCSASISLTCASIALPLIADTVTPLISKLESLRENSAAADMGQPLRVYSMPAKSATTAKPASAMQLPYTSWQFLLSLSLIPISVQLPNGLCAAKVTLSNAFLWSKREPNAEAAVEARVALHDLTVLEWPEQSFRAVLLSPIFIGVQGKLPTLLRAQFNVSVSAVEARMSAEQVKLLLCGAASECNGRRDPALTFLNDSGSSVSLRCGTHGSITIPGQGVNRQRTMAVAAPVHVMGIDDVAEPRGGLLAAGAGISGEGASDQLFVVTRSSGDEVEQRCHCTSILHGDLRSDVVFRSVVHLRNDTPFSFVVTSLSGDPQPILPTQVSCVPHYMLASTDLNLSAAGGARCAAADCYSPLFAGGKSPLDVYHDVVTNGGPLPPPLHREVVVEAPGGATQYIETALSTSGEVLTLSFRAIRPYIVNRTIYTVAIEVLNDQAECLSRHVMAPGAKVVLFSVAPDIILRGRVELHIGDDAYISSDQVPLFDAAAAASKPDVEMKHKVYPRRYFFQLQLEATPSTATTTGFIAITAGGMCLVKNCSAMDLTFSNESGDPVGTMGSVGLQSGAEARHNVGYVPINAVLRIKPKGSALSEAFEMDESSSGSVIQCDSSPEVSAFSATYLLLHLANTTERMFEVLPAVVFRNPFSSRTLQVKHVVRETGSATPLESMTFCIAPQGTHLYHTMSKYGYTNDLVFSWVSSASSEAAAEDSAALSSVVETDFAPSTMWSGFISCGSDTHHRLDIVKGSLYEPAYVTISAPLVPPVKLVNISPVSFVEVGSLQVAFPQPSRGNKLAILTRHDGSSHGIDLLQEDAVEMEPGLWVHVVSTAGEHRTVILSDGRTPVNTAKPWWREVQITTEAHIPSIRLCVREGDEVPLQMVAEAFSMNGTWWGGTFSVQGAVASIAVLSVYEGCSQYVAEPFGVDCTIREARMTGTDAYINSFQVSLRPLVITISDVLLYQIQMLGSRCFTAATSTVMAFVQQDPEVAVKQRCPISMARRLHIGSAIISEVPLELSWDRSVRPPPDYQMTNSGIARLVPSLHHAALVIPKLQLRRISRVSAAELLGRVRQILVMEVVKQIPNMMTTVGLFKKNSSLLSKVSSTVSEFLFGRRTNLVVDVDNTDDGSSLV